jgi:hypothetical protein
MANRRRGSPAAGLLPGERAAIPEKHDDADLLNAAMQKGFPDRHRLVMTTDFVDRRKALFKAIDETAWWWIAPFPKERPGRTAWPGMR